MAKTYIIFIIILIVSMLGIETLNGHVLRFKKIKIAYVIKKKCINDKNINQIGITGVDRYDKEVGIKLDLIEINDKNNKKSLQKLKKVVRNNELIIVVGDYFEKIVSEVSKLNKEKKFIATSANIKEDNVKNIIFRYKEAGYILGFIIGKTKIGNVGFIGIEGTRANEEIIKGINTYLKDENLEKYKIDEMNFYKTIKKCSCKNKSYKIAKEMYDEGCDIIVSFLGEAQEGVFKAAKQSNKLLITIGVNNFQHYRKIKKILIASLVINFDEIIYKNIMDIKRGRYENNDENHKGYGIKEKILEIVVNDEIVDEKTIKEIEEFKKIIVYENLEL
jgi:basic membrane protein A and related proteins